MRRGCFGGDLRYRRLVLKPPGSTLLLHVCSGRLSVRHMAFRYPCLGCKKKIKRRGPGGSVLQKVGASPETNIGLRSELAKRQPEVGSF